MQGYVYCSQVPQPTCNWQLGNLTRCIGTLISNHFLLLLFATKNWMDISGKQPYFVSQQIFPAQISFVIQNISDFFFFVFFFESGTK